MSFVKLQHLSAGPWAFHLLILHTLTQLELKTVFYLEHVLKDTRRSFHASSKHTQSLFSTRLLLCYNSYPIDDLISSKARHASPFEMKVYLIYVFIKIEHMPALAHLQFISDITLLKTVPLL